MKTSYIIWAIFWLGVFLPLEMLGVFHVFGWRSLSETTWSLEAAAPWVKALVLCGLMLLASHLCLGWPH